MTDLRPALGALLLALSVACGPSEGDPPAAAESDSGPVIDSAATGELMADSWMAALARDPAGLSALLDAPGGEGWLDLYHGDLASAKRTFERADSASARLGLARVHLARAHALMSAGRLHREAALDLARYRRDHRDAVRTGAYELVLAALTANVAGVQGDELAAFEAAANDPSPERADPVVDAALRALLAGADAPPRGLPELYAARQTYAARAEAGDLDGIQALATRVHSSDPDLIDPLGEDVEAGVRFEARHYDARFLPAAARVHLAHAWIQASALEGPGPLITSAVRSAWGGDLPAAVRDGALPPADPLPAWTALFASHAVDEADWDAMWGGTSEGFSDRFCAAAGIAPNGDVESTDALLRALSELEPAMVDALKDGAPEDGAALVDELGLVSAATDRVLRSAMLRLVDEDHSVQAKRLGDRSLDVNAGSRGGAADSARTRVSYRNDRSFLIDYARCLWRAGQAGAALDFVHPLAGEDPALQSVKHYLGQLDAAASIGLQGKTSQL